MATGTVVKAWKDELRAYLAVRVAENNGENIEYIGETPLTKSVLNEETKKYESVAKTATEVKADLVAAVKAIRDKQQAQAKPVAVSGSVTL